MIAIIFCAIGVALWNTLGVVVSSPHNDSKWKSTLSVSASPSLLPALQIRKEFVCAITALLNVLIDPVSAKEVVTYKAAVMKFELPFSGTLASPLLLLYQLFVVTNC